MQGENSAKRRFDPLVVFYMILIHSVALYALPFVSVQNLVILFVLYIVTAGGITLGFHRLFTHRAFKVPKWLEYIIALCGTLAYQGGLREWVAHHRMHHAFGDTDKDPHNASRGFWYSHIGWLFYYDPRFDDMKVLKSYARDIEADPFLRFISNDLFVLFFQLAFAGLLWASMGFEAMLWGVFVRLAFVYHVTWFVNSAAHKFGYVNYKIEGDRSTNCWWVGLLALGEGWHNNHHVDGGYANYGHKWWEFDATYLVICALEKLGLASHVKRTSFRELQEKMS